MAAKLVASTAQKTQLEVVISFGTTGSMYQWLDSLRDTIKNMIERLQMDIPDIRIAVFAHGDYCDAETSYVTKWVDLTTSVSKLCHFVKTVGCTDGGHYPECYELVLRQVGSELSWTPGSRRVLVMIGDSVPHEVDDPCNKGRINWREELEKLVTMGVIIYGVQCGDASSSFYETMATKTSGKHLRLENIGSLYVTLVAVCLRESKNTAKLISYEKEVREKSGEIGPAADLDTVLHVLRQEEEAENDTKSEVNDSEKDKESSARAQTEESEEKDSKKDIDSFVIAQPACDVQNHCMSASIVLPEDSLHREKVLVIKIQPSARFRPDYATLKRLIVNGTCLSNKDIASLYRFQTKGRWYMQLTSEAELRYYSKLHCTVVHGAGFELMIQRLDLERHRVELTWVPPTLQNKMLVELMKALTNDPYIEIQDAAGRSDRKWVLVSKKASQDMPLYLNLVDKSSNTIYHTIRIKVPDRRCINCGKNVYWPRNESEMLGEFLKRDEEEEEDEDEKDDED